MMSLHDIISKKATPAGLFWAVLLVAMAVLVVSAGLAAALRDREPLVALQFLPTDARAAVRQADNLMARGSGRNNIEKAAKYARAALARDITLPGAWRTLALTMPSGSSSEVRLLDMAQRVSRRDIPTQLALIEQRVDQGDITGALKHYDTVLRVSAAYDPLLFPVLTSAMADPEIRPTLAQRLRDAPSWRRRFLSYVVNADTSYGAQADLFSALAAAGPLGDRDIVAAQATNSVSAGNAAIGERLYRLIEPVEAAKAIRNGGFEQDGGVPPFDWVFDSDLNVTVSPFDGGRRLEIVSERGDGGRAARQMLHLPTGGHDLRAEIGTIEDYPAGTPYLVLSCAETGTPLASLDGTGTARIGRTFTVPANCGRQWLDIGLRQSMDAGRVATWIDAITIQ